MVTKLKTYRAVETIVWCHYLNSVSDYDDFAVVNCNNNSDAEFVAKCFNEREQEQTQSEILHGEAVALLQEIEGIKTKELHATEKLQAIAKLLFDKFTKPNGKE